MRTKLIAACSLTLYTLLITYLLLGRFDQEIKEPIIPYMDKVVHLGIFLIFNLLILIVSLLYRQTLTSRYITLITLFVIGYSVAIEVIQPHFGRQFDLWDIVANSAGALCGVVAYAISRKIVRRVM